MLLSGSVYMNIAIITNIYNDSMNTVNRSDLNLCRSCEPKM